MQELPLQVHWLRQLSKAQVLYAYENWEKPPISSSSAGHQLYDILHHRAVAHRWSTASLNADSMCVWRLTTGKLMPVGWQT